jgi:hypothetical protein
MEQAREDNEGFPVIKARTRKSSAGLAEIDDGAAFSKARAETCLKCAFLLKVLHRACRERWSKIWAENCKNCKGAIAKASPWSVVRSGRDYGQKRAESIDSALSHRVEASIACYSP